MQPEPEVNIVLCLGLISKAVVRVISGTVGRRVELPGCMDDLIEGRVSAVRCLTTKV